MNYLNHFKNLEKEFSRVFVGNGFLGLRLDGKNFSSFTKQFEAPFDFKFMDAMEAATLKVISSILPSIRLAYVQSDEISFIIPPSEITGEYPFAGKFEKILSLSAAAATSGFLRKIPDCSGDPIFDARLFPLESKDEVRDYLDWRRLDARKNSVSMAASCLFSHRKLMGVSTKERAILLEGTEFEKLPEGFFNGRILWKETDPEKGRAWIIEPALRDRTYDLVDIFC